MKPTSASGPERGAVDGLLAYAQQRGVEYTRSGIASLSQRAGLNAARAWIDEVAAAEDGLRDLGITMRRPELATRLGAAGSAAVLLDRIQTTRTRRAARLARPCIVRRRAADPTTHSNDLARCGCRRCYEQLPAAVRKLTFVMAAKFPEFPQSVAVAEAHVALVQALDDYHAKGCPGDFAGFYVSEISLQLRELLRGEKRCDRNTAVLVSLDAPIVGAGHDSDRFVSYGDRIPDRTTSTERIVLARETLREIVEAARARVAVAGSARVAAGVVA